MKKDDKWAKVTLDSLFSSGTLSNTQKKVNFIINLIYFALYPNFISEYY